MKQNNGTQLLHSFVLIFGALQLLFLLSAAVYAVIFLLMERHCRSQKAKYDAALEWYKKQTQ